MPRSLTDILGAALLLLAFAPAVHAAGDDDAKRKIRVGMSADFYPMIYPNAKGELEGTDIDFLNELAKHLKRQFSKQKVPFEKLISGVSTYQFDLAVAAMDLAPPGENVEFIEYFTLPDALVVKGASPLKDDPKLDWKKLKVGAVATSAARTFYAQEADMGRIAKARGFEGELALMDALERGYVDAVVMHLPAAIEKVKKSGGKLRILKRGVCRQPLGIAVPKTSTGLTKQIREAVQELRKNGTTAKLEAKAEAAMLEQITPP